MRRLKGPKGLTLVELAVAILVLSIFTLATMRSFDSVTKAATGLDARVLGRIALQNRAEELKLFGPNANLPAEVTIANQSIRLDTQKASTAGGLIETTLTARVDGQAGVQIILYLDPLERR